MASIVTQPGGMPSTTASQLQRPQSFDTLGETIAESPAGVIGQGAYDLAQGAARLPKIVYDQAAGAVQGLAQTELPGLDPFGAGDVGRRLMGQPDRPKGPTFGDAMRKIGLRPDLASDVSGLDPNVSPPESIAGQLGQGVASVIPAFAGAALTGGGTIPMTLMAAAQSYGSAFRGAWERAQQMGANEEQANQIADAQAVAAGVTTALTQGWVGKALQGIRPQTLERAVQRAVNGGQAESLLKVAIKEGGQEGIEELNAILSQYVAEDDPTTLQNAPGRLAMAVGAGTLGGGVIAGVQAVGSQQGQRQAPQDYPAQRGALASFSPQNAQQFAQPVPRGEQAGPEASVEAVEQGWPPEVANGVPRYPAQERDVADGLRPVGPGADRGGDVAQPQDVQPVADRVPEVVGGEGAQAGNQPGDVDVTKLTLAELRSLDLQRGGTGKGTAAAIRKRLSDQPPQTSAVPQTNGDVLPGSSPSSSSSQGPETLPTVATTLPATGRIEQPSPTSSQSAGSVREPWEMTRAEWIGDGKITTEAGVEAITSPGFATEAEARAWAKSRGRGFTIGSRKTGNGPKVWTAQKIAGALRSGGDVHSQRALSVLDDHRAEVERAIAEGKIKYHPDYPDLQPKAAAPEARKNPFFRIEDGFKGLGYSSIGPMEEGAVSYGTSSFPTLTKGPVSFGISTTGLWLNPKHGNVHYNATWDRLGEEAITLNAIIVDESARKSGVGTKAMNDLLSLADREGVTIYLEPAAIPKYAKKTGLKDKALAKWYKKFGFVQKVEGHDALLVRAPKEAKSGVLDQGNPSGGVSPQGSGKEEGPQPKAPDAETKANTKAQAPFESKGPETIKAPDVKVGQTWSDPAGNKVVVYDVRGDKVDVRGTGGKLGGTLNVLQFKDFTLEQPSAPDVGRAGSPPDGGKAPAGVGASSAMKRRGLKGDALANAMDRIGELRDNGAQVDDDGYVTLYHRTTPEKADAIRKSGMMRGEEDGLFFSTSKTGQADGFGDAIVVVREPVERVELDDVFGNEAHVRIPLKRAGQSVRVGVVSDTPTATEAKGTPTPKDLAALKAKYPAVDFKFIKGVITPGAAYMTPKALAEWRNTASGVPFKDQIALLDARLAKPAQSSRTTPPTAELSPPARPQTPERAEATQAQPKQQPRSDTANQASQPPSTPEGRPEQTSARKEWTTEDRSAMGLDTIDSPARRSWEEALGRGKDTVDEDKARSLVYEINNTPENQSARILNDIETGGLVVEAARLKNKHREKLAEVEGMSSDEQIAAAGVELTRLEEDFDAITRALRRSGTEKGRALAAQKLTIDSDLSLVSVKSRAKAKKGKPLTEAESKAFAEQTAQLEAANKKIAELEEAMSKQVADRAIGRARRHYAKLSPEQRATELADANAKAKALLDAGCKNA